MSAEQIMTVNQMETPASTVGALELPGGYLDPHTKELHRTVMVREISGFEEDMLASEQIDGHGKLDALLSACTTRIGEFTDPGKIASIVPKLPIGDRVALLFAIRRTTLGNEMPVREKCPATLPSGKPCNTTSLFVVDLSDLKHVPMPDPMKRIHDLTLPSGIEARFRVSTGEDEKALSRLKEKEKADKLSLSLMMRLELLAGEPPTLLAVKKLGMRDRHALRSAFEKVEGGVDTSLELTCPSCGHEWKSELNVSASGFFSLSGT